MADLFEQITDDYMPMLLNWSYKKTGERERAEDLTQEVLLQILSAIRKSPVEIQDVEHFVWKIAHYTWCNELRSKMRGKCCISMENLQLEDGRDFAAEYAEQEYRQELTARMRERVSRLSYLQREIMISFYLEGKSVREIAQKHQMTESAVKWHLFQTRKKLKKEIGIMENKDFVYRPHKLHMGISGQAASMAAADITMIDNSLTKQNICIACYRQSKTAQELAEQLGIPMAYIESDLEWLVEREFVEKEASAYSASFLIEGLADTQAKYAVYLKHREALSDVILEGLTKAEEAVRAIGFHGSDGAYDRLLWMLIYQFAIRLRIPYPDFERPARMDGGKYLPLGFDSFDDGTVPKVLDTGGWAYNGSMQNDNFTWFGMYNFGHSEIEDMMDACDPQMQKLHGMLCEILHSDYDISGYDEQKRFTLAQLAQKGFVRVEGKRAIPNFCVFTEEHYARLQEEVFDPIAAKLETVTRLLVADLEECCRGRLPGQLKYLYKASVALALGDIGYLTTFFAFQEGKLYRPADTHDGEFLTLVYVRR